MKANPPAVIACDKREAFAQGSASDEAIQTSSFRGGAKASNPDSRDSGSGASAPSRNDTAHHAGSSYPIADSIAIVRCTAGRAIMRL
jgi:hypothetical protein